MVLKGVAWRYKDKLGKFGIIWARGKIEFELGQWQWEEKEGK